MWTENPQLCLTNAAYEYFITQAGKSKSQKQHLKILGGQGAEGREKQIPQKLNCYCRTKNIYLKRNIFDYKG